jgi:Zn-dependent protease/predicted transcriptional regulator/ribosomal protein L40E
LGNRRKDQLSVKLGKIMGIPITIHYTLWLVFALIAWSLAVGYMPSQYPGLGVVTYWVIGIVSSVILFASVLIHELSHSYIAKKDGLPIARITLFFFGGVSEITEEPQDPDLEVRMAAAGPLMSFLIAGALGAFWYLTRLVNAPVAVTATLGYGALINAVLGIFNLLPAFPLDGGRVFRGSIWKCSKNFIGATRTATRVSEAISLLMMAGGFASIIFGDFVDGLWIVFLGWFIRSGAETSLRQTIVDETLSGVTVERIMTRDVLTIPPSITIQQLVSDYFLVHRHEGYPVVKDGQILGIITLHCVRAIPKDRRETETVEQAMVHCEPTVTVRPMSTALDILHKMASARVERVLVVDDGRLLGIVTRGDLIRTIRARQELGSIPRSEASRLQMASKRCIQCGATLPAEAQVCTQCGARQPP